MIDIHCHILYGVDDGPKSRRESVALLKDAQSQGINKIILTPHYRKGMFDYPFDMIQDHFEFLKLYAEEIGIELFLGCEYHIDNDIIENLKNKRCLTLAESKYVLAEYSHETPFEYMIDSCNELLSHGFTPIIAHIERYACFEKDITRVEHMKQLGCLIQLNASSVIGKSKIGSKKFCHTLLLRSLVDLIGSDCHNLVNRPNHMNKCYLYIAHTFSQQYAQNLFVNNPNIIISSQTQK